MTPAHIRDLNARYVEHMSTLQSNDPCADVDLADEIAQLFRDLLALPADDVGLGTQVSVAVHYVFSAARAWLSYVESQPELPPSAVAAGVAVAAA